jgi:hypothetical protein
MKAEKFVTLLEAEWDALNRISGESRAEFFSGFCRVVDLLSQEATLGDISHATDEIQRLLHGFDYGRTLLSEYQSGGARTRLLKPPQRTLDRKEITPSQVCNRLKQLRHRISSPIKPAT